ncbi:MAG: GNAT family N-acetyltransferase [Salinivirgaceae bacterium]|nr:GNAT family N-acetyltransferase [Salinivirgaceae bacterium]
MSLLNIEIKKYKLSELANLFETDFIKNSEVLPISKNRLESYQNNPRAQDQDIVLYLAVLNNKIVGFRTILADIIYKENIAFKFGWFSGNWVHSEYRRRGVSTSLFNEVYRDWKGRLMFTNYAPNSKKLYDKSNKFDLLNLKEGLRLYYKSTLHKIIPKRIPQMFFITPLLKILDYLINVFLSPYSKLWNRQFGISKTIEIASELSAEDYRFIVSNARSVFNRGEEELKWIFNYPWLIASKHTNNNYPFSQFAKRFEYISVKSRSENGTMVSLAILKIRDDQLTIPYFFDSTSSLQMLESIISIGLNKNVETITFYHEQLLSRIAKVKTRAIFSKKMVQKYFIMKSFAKNIDINTHNLNIQDGDGDCFFT